MPARKHHRGAAGFTVSELVLVVGLVAVLVLVAVTSVRGIRSETAVADCQTQLRTLKLATEQYRSERGAYPADEDALESEGYLKADDAPDWRVRFETSSPEPVYEAAGSRCR